jgi:hypothetical protein
MKFKRLHPILESNFFLKKGFILVTFHLQLGNLPLF